MATSLLDPADYARLLALRDLTDATLGPHAMQLLVQQAIDALRAAWHCPVVVYRAPPVVSVSENYDDLGYPADGAAREARYTRYVTSELLLRTQTSAMVPRALRMIAAAHYRDVLLVCPGLTYRRDSIDRLHVGEPHQLEVWRIARRHLTRSDMEAMIELVANAMLPGVTLRLDAVSHPYTVDGLEVHGNVGGPDGDGRWVEILECGLAHPQLLQRYADLPHSAGSGLAMGIGLDRMLMLRKGIDDIRVLRSSDPRIVAQMQDLQPYRPVSSQPAIHRDLSIAVDATATAEELGDGVRTAVGERSRSIESVQVLAQTSYLDLSVAARRRLGIAPDQKNVLLRLVIRDLERTLTSAEANVLRDEIYAALHRGSVKTWASKEMHL
jgi:phenylalanyl-tRNA synthetase alpha chain